MEHLGGTVVVREVERDHLDARECAAQRLDSRPVRPVAVAGEQRPVVKNGQLTIATVMTVTMTCDHRVVDGATGARFLQAFKPLIEDPVTMLA